MFTLEQIEAEQAKIQSAADFPAFVKALKALGVASFTTHAIDSSTTYNGATDFSITSLPLYPKLEINEAVNPDNFLARLKMHQQRKTDYFTFCKDCLENGVVLWKVKMDEMTCEYVDKDFKTVHIERIPA